MEDNCVPIQILEWHFKAISTQNWSYVPTWYTYIATEANLMNVLNDKLINLVI